MLVSPLVAFSLGFAVMLAIMWIFRNANPSTANRGFKIAQTHLRGRHGAGARPPGRAEDDGRHLPGAAHRRLRRPSPTASRCG